MTPKEVLEFAKKNKVEIVDFKFVDVPGLWQHFSIPAAELTAELFEEGIGFDGSSIRGIKIEVHHHEDLYELEPEEAAKVKSMPGSLDQALDALEKDHDFLLRGDVFTKDVIETWLEYKRKKEVDAIRLRPHPYEFALYFDI